MKNKLVLLLALVFGLTAACGLYGYLLNLKEAYRDSGDFTRIATAKQRIPAKTLLNEQMLTFVDLPAKYVLPGVTVDTKDVVGKLARYDIYPGEQILSTKLIEKNDPVGGLAAKVEKGKRAVTVPVNNVASLHGLLGPGDHVDVVATFDTSGTPSFVAASTIVQNVPVLAVNRITESNLGVKEEPLTVTVMVLPDQAQQIALTVQQGSIQLILRSPTDNDLLPLPMSKLGHLMR